MSGRECFCQDKTSLPDAHKSDFFKKYDFSLWELAIGGKLGYFNSHHIHTHSWLKTKNTKA